ncbi:MAG: orotate phosphoribosyltransferase [Chloroflexota bacterium]|nr:orotate phosphoribosyltransferase [Chloroflexota bacterium]
MDPAEVEAIFRESGALADGHFILSSGAHSQRYLEKFQVLQWPARTERLCAAIVAAVRPLGMRTVAGPTTGGIILAHEVARQMRLRAVYAERADDGRGRRFRRGFHLARDETVLVVDDIMTTGGSMRETIDAVRAEGARVAGAAVLVDRSGSQAPLGDIPLVALWRIAIPTFPPESCPQCAAGVPTAKPGTTPAPAPCP